MVTRINTGKNISKALNYNEQKVQDKKAVLLTASGFLKETGKMNFYDKQKHFQKHTSLNEKATTNTLHVSLNFDPSEKITDEKLVAIADDYMQKIGFGKQPYLVYRHDDAAHPHIHIVSTNIESDGKRISMHNIGRNQSEKARKEIEIEFGLVKADSKKITEAQKIIPVTAKKVIYGKSETKRAIANVLRSVIDQYKYTSLPELNAVLQLYNVVAEEGLEGSKMHSGKGLMFRVLDDYGDKIGAPIKASAFYMKPTLKNLEKKFEENESLRLTFRKKIQTKIAWILNKPVNNIDEFKASLEKENISLVLRKGKGEVVFGITYVDHSDKCVFNGSDLGKQFSAKAVLAICDQQNDFNLLHFQNTNSVTDQKNRNQVEESDKQQKKQVHIDLPNAGDAPGGNYVPYQLKKKKKKKRKQLSL